ncbi:MAG: ATP-binding protein [Proteobacteria bacterium]|nr:ATP-binding protein [Pseudomonadota bacterium]
MSSKKRINFWGRLDVKLTIYYTTIFLILSIMLCSFFFYRVSRNLLKQIDRILMDGTFEFINMVENDEQDLLSICQAYAKGLSVRKHYPIYFRVLTRDNKVYFESENTQGLAASPFKPKIHPLLEFLKLLGRTHPYRYYKDKFTMRNGTNYTIQMATDIELIKLTLRNLLENILIVIPVLLILSVWWGLFVLKKYREIVGNIVKVTNRITSQNLQERLTVPEVSDELQHLMVTINSMIDRLETALQEVKQFTADVSHELRNPLFALKGELEVALSRERSDGEYGEAILESLERTNLLIKMVNDLFLISRFDMKKIDINLIYLNLSEIVRDLFDFFLPMAQEKNLQFSIERCDDVVFCGDKTRMHQLFSNLLDNAIKFTPEQGTVTLSLISLNESVQFKVRDTGIGITEDDMPNIFNRFYQSDKSRSGVSRGAGLGLHICKRIVEAHGGDITIVRNVHQGVTFVVTLPVHE